MSKKKEQSSKSSGSKLEDDLMWMLLTNGFPTPEPQKPMSPNITPKRKWVVDFVFRLPEGKYLHVEVQGGTWIRGRHSRGTGARSDSQKLNYAACLDIRTLYVTSDMVKDKTALDWIYLALFHSKTGYGKDDPYRLPGGHHRTPLKHYLEEREKYYGEPLTIEAICRKRRKRRKNRSANKGGSNRARVRDTKQGRAKVTSQPRKRRSLASKSRGKKSKASPRTTRNK